MTDFLELRTQQHLMDAEGSSDSKPIKKHVIREIKKYGYRPINFDAHFDNLQQIWRWTADLVKLGK